MELIDEPSDNDEDDLWFSIDVIIWIVLISLVTATVFLVLGLLKRLISHPGVYKTTFQKIVYNTYYNYYKKYP